MNINIKTFVLIVAVVFLFHSTDMFSQEKHQEIIKSEGLIQLLFSYNTTEDAKPNNEFLIKRLRLGLNGKLNNWIVAKLEIDPSDLNRDFLKDAKLKFNLNEKLGLTFGRQKVPFSLERLTSVKNISFFDRSKIVKEMDDLGYAGRDLGLSVSLSHKLFGYRLQLMFGVFNGNQKEILKDNNNSKSFFERVEISKDKSIQVGLNSAQKFDSLSGNYFVGNGIDLKLRLSKKLDFVFELLYGKKSASVSVGGMYTGIEYDWNNIILGLRWNNYYRDIKKSIPENFIESKIDWKPHKKFWLRLSSVVSLYKDEIKNQFLIGTTYVF